MNITIIELSLVLPLFFMCVGVLMRNWRHGSMSVWSPMSLICVLYLYYTVIGPLYFIATNNTEFLGVEFRQIYWKGWLASLISFVFVGAGYLSYRGRKGKIGQVCSDALLQKFALVLFGVSFIAIMYSLASSNSISSAFNPLSGAGGDVETTQLTTFRFAGFWVNLINLSIPAIVLSLLLWLQKRSTYTLVLLLLISMFSVAYFLRTGFRFRIVWTVIAALSSYYLWKRQRPNPLLVIGGAVFFVAAMGLIGMTRNYYGGLNLEKSTGASFGDFIDRGFSESGTFTSLCSIIDTVPEKINYTYWDPLWITLTLPIPRVLWPEKPKSLTLRAVGLSFGAKGGEDAGQAISFYGEWYIAWGWPGLIVSSFIFGWLSKRMWVWFLQRREDKLVILSYTVTLGYLYFVFSRGYTPLMVLNFTFGLLPFFMFYGWLRRKAFAEAFRRIFLFQKKAMEEERARQQRMAELAGRGQE